MWFDSVKELLGIKNDEDLATVLSSSNCLSTIARSTQLQDISNLVDLISNIKVKNKYLMVQTPPLNTTLLQSKKINFNVMINEVDSGMKKLQKLDPKLSHKIFYLCRWKCQNHISMPSSGQNVCRGSARIVPLDIATPYREKNTHIFYWSKALYQVQTNHWWK